MKNKLLINLSLLTYLLVCQSSHAIPCPNLDHHQANQIVANMRQPNPINIFENDPRRR